MKRYGRLHEKICASENIELAIERAERGRKKKTAIRWFNEDKERLTEELRLMLEHETYTVSKYSSFNVSEPKERTIHCLPFYPDRIIQHAIMNVICPIFIEKFTSDTYSCIKDRGIHQCVAKLKTALEDKEHTAYYLQIDIRKYYPSIDREILKAKLRRIIKCERTLRLIDKIVDSHHESGIPIGNYISQYLSNYYLSDVDHYVKEQLGVKYYFRYADDLLFFGSAKQEMNELLKKIITEVEKLNLKIKNNIRISPTERGIDFIGYKFYPTHTLLRKSIKQRMKQKIKMLKGVDDMIFKTQMASHYGWAKHCNAKNLLTKTMGERAKLYEKI